MANAKPVGHALAAERNEREIAERKLRREKQRRRRFEQALPNSQTALTGAVADIQTTALEGQVHVEWLVAELDKLTGDKSGAARLLRDLTQLFDALNAKYPV